MKKHEDTVKKFNQSMIKVSNRETRRIDSENQYALAIAANAGKDLDFFSDPDLETKKRADVRQKHKG